MKVTRHTLPFLLTAYVMFGVAVLILVWILPLAFVPDLFGWAGVVIAVLLLACALIGLNWFRAERRVAAWCVLGIGAAVFISAASALIFYMTLP